MTKFSPLPIDKNGRAIQGVIVPYIHTISMDGTYKAITIPSGYECKSVLIKMQDGSSWNYSHTDTPTVPYIPVTELSFDISAVAGETIGYANGTSGQTLAVFIAG